MYVCMYIPLYIYIYRYALDIPIYSHYSFANMAWPWLRVKGSCAEPGLTEFESGAERSGNDWVPMLQWSCLWFFNWATSWGICFFFATTHRIHGAAIYGNMDPINIPQSC